MSGFGGFGSGGFGTNTNQNQTSSAFGGFGSTQTAGGFGSNTGGAFGSTANTGGGLFGNSTNTNTASTGFGGGFGTGATSSPFGQSKPAFGATATTTTAGGLFGGGTATSGTGFGGGFGSTGGFGNNASSGFGANKPGFGATTTSTGMFGSTGTGFGASTSGTTSGFGQSTSPFAGNQTNNGTPAGPFNPHSEKEPSSNVNNVYQTITAQPNFNKFSMEELRVVDYAQGRKYGNQSGQAGAFGASTGFGGFGANANTASTGFGGGATGTGTGLFGNTPASTPFGGTQTATASGFGASTGGGLFGAPKPAGTGLFGNTAAATTGTATSGLFGSSGATSGFGTTPAAGTGFGATAATGFGNTGTNKPFGTGFGSTTTTGFGATNTATGGGLFGGGQAASTPFGQTQQTQPATGFSFGQQNQQPQQQQQTQTGLFGGGFGQQNQAKPGGLFGASATTTGGGIFGQQQPAQQQSFGGANTQQSGGIFGQKPATTGMFGSTTTNTGGGMFGGVQQQPIQQQPGGLFGLTNNQQAGGLYGQKPATTGLFGSSAANTGGLFGGSQQQPQQNGLGSSLFSSTQQQPQQAQQQTHLLANITDNPYGNVQLFAGLQSPSQSMGPLATPLSASQKAKRQAVIPHHRIMPHASSRLITPQKRSGVYGFSYSNYNSPASVSSNNSPIGYNASLLGGSMSRSLGKSFSTSNLRHSYTAQESIITPGSFTNVTRSGPGSMKKLNINRNLSSRRSLFGTDAAPATVGGTLTKRVSFEDSAAQNRDLSPTSPSISGALVPIEDTENGVMSDAASSPQLQTNGSNGNELAIVPEDPSPDRALQSANIKARQFQKDQTPGGYTMVPSIEEIQAMSRAHRSKLRDFSVSREGVGKIVFSQVDLTNIPLEQICGQIVELELRRATVYGDHSPMKTPPQGQGLNVPSRITLENSWPRAKGARLNVPERSSRAIEKHTRLLRMSKDTTFISYEEQSGRWTFEVQHYTTYGLEYDDDDDESIMDSTVLDNTFAGEDGHDASTGFAQTTPFVQAGSSNGSSAGSLDDTFDFKRGKRVTVPGQFNVGEFVEDLVMVDEQDQVPFRSSFLDEHPPANVEEMVLDEEEDRMFDEEEDLLPGSFTGAEHPISAPEQEDSVIEHTPKRIEQLIIEPNWTEQLLQTASPKKLDRHILREKQEMSPPGYSVSERRPLEINRMAAFGTTVDIMKSLFETSTGKENGIEASNSKSKRDSSNQQATKADQKKSNGTRTGAGNEVHSRDGAKLPPGTNLVPGTIIEQRAITNITFQDDAEAPEAQTSEKFKFAAFATATDISTARGKHENEVWQLASILFDDPSDEFPPYLASEAVELYEIRLRKEKLSIFWRKLVQDDVDKQLFTAKSNEERAFLYLTAGNVPEACAALLAGSNFHLAQIVSQIGGDKVFRDTMAQQLDDWLELNIASEINDYIRAIYELLAGRTLECKGKKGPGPENKVPTLKFSLRFNLDWKRAFGLRLWYGIMQSEDVASAIIEYSADLDARREPAKPLPWFVANKEDMGWDDPTPFDREDALWGILKYYSSEYIGLSDDPDETSTLANLFIQENTSGNPLDSRLSFQLVNLLRACRDDNLQSTITESNEIAAKYAESLESQLPTNPELLVVATWVLEHITEPKRRTSLIKDLLDNNAKLLVENESICAALSNDTQGSLQIPYAWICASKAKYAQTTLKDPVAEAKWLVEGGELLAAHDVVCRTIGPNAVIEKDFNSLREVVGKLLESDVLNRVDWDKGAGLYFDYVELLDLQTGTKRSAEAKGSVKKLVKKLAGNLEGVANDGEGRGKIEMIALKIVAKEVVDIGNREGALEPERVLRLPMSQSGYLEQSRLLSLRYYEAMLVKAR